MSVNVVTIQTASTVTITEDDYEVVEIDASKLAEKLMNVSANMDEVAQKASDLVAQTIRIIDSQAVIIQKSESETIVDLPKMQIEGKPDKQEDPEIVGEDAGDKSFVKDVMNKRADIDERAVYDRTAAAASIRNRNKPIYMKHIGICSATGATIGGFVGASVGLSGGPYAPVTCLGGALIGTGAGAVLGAGVGVAVATYRIHYVYEQNFRYWREAQSVAIYREFTLKFQKCQQLQVCYDTHFQRIMTFPSIDSCGHIFDADYAEAYIERHGRCPIDHNKIMQSRDLKVDAFQFGQMEAALELVLSDKTKDVQFTDKEKSGLRAFKQDIGDRCDKFLRNDQEKLDSLRKERGMTEREYRSALNLTVTRYENGRKSVIKA